MRSTKPKPTPLELSNTTTLRGKKQRDVFTKVYDVRETIFSDQTGQFPTRSQKGHKYIMVMVEIDSNAVMFANSSGRGFGLVERTFFLV